jgi:hypothetical protein
MISLAACGALWAQPVKTPAIAILEGADAAQWRTWAGALGWRVLVPGVDLAPDAVMDTRLLSLATVVQEAVKTGGVDPARVYLAGRGAAAGAVFYGVSRMPDMWAAGFAAGGSPQAALDSNRVFSVNFQNTPVLWVGQPEDQPLAQKLKQAGLNVEWRNAEGLSIGSAFEWLAAHKREEFPMAADCETTATAFGRCWWVQLTKLDAAERNDALPLSLIPGSTGARLDLGAFSYKVDDPGPGALVNALSEKYSGPLKLGDRLVSLDGKPIENARQLNDVLSKASEEKTAVVLVQRGKDRLRVETRIVLPRRDAFVAARVQARYTPEEHEILVITRSVAELRVTIPPHWVPARLNWNGLAIEQVKDAGCLALKTEKELLHAERCPQ